MSMQDGARRAGLPAFSARTSVKCRNVGAGVTPVAVNRRIKRIGERAGLPFPVHAHLLRHACGYALANAGHDTRRIQDCLGHRSIQHTVRSSELSATPFKDFWRWSFLHADSQTRQHATSATPPGLGSLYLHQHT